jgi:acyl dehydratase
MAINLDIIGKRTEPAPFTYTSDTVILYAMGIGAGVESLGFVYEKNLKVFPTFAAIPFMPILLESFIPKANINLYALLHGEHRIVLHKPIPPSGTLYTTTVCDAVYDKGDKGAMIHIAFETRDETGVLLFENKPVLVDRSAGNFGGDRGPKPTVFNPPENKAPAFRMAYTTSPDQAALYRLSGDKNPIHIDPAFARKAGLERPILHGLCSFGVAGRAVLKSVCNDDPTRLKSFSARFMNVVYPGDKLITEGWHVDAGTYIIRTTNQDGQTVLGNSVVETGLV